MTLLQSDGTAVEWGEPALARPRGTLVVLAGRGESTATYRRFSTRVHADAYRALVYSDTSEHSGTPEHSDTSGQSVAAARIDAIAAELRTALALDELPRPLVIVGSDIGAVAAIDLSIALGDDVAATILAGYPTAGGSGFSGDRASELLERTTCVVHRGVLDTDTRFVEGTLAHALSDEDVQRDLGALPGRVLTIHGGADLISPFDEVRAVYESAEDSEIWVIDGAKHDVLNDSTHRTTAALVIQYLERLRSGSTELIARRVS